MTYNLENLPKIKGNYRFNATLKNWFNVGGKAEVIFRPANIEDLAFFLKNCPSEIPIHIIGAASNVIIRDQGVKGVVIRFGKEFNQIHHDNNIITVGAGTLCANVALYSKNAALSNLEFLSGIPGSIGGAIAMNGGCYGNDISQILLTAKAVDFSGNIIELNNEDFGFFYRGSKIAKDFIFVEASFKGENSTSSEVGQKIAQLTKNRQETQPIRAKTGGSTFKNPPNLKAWQLIDEAGCRGMTQGDAQISPKHCNFMINRGQATAQDLIDLSSKVQKMVKEKSGLDLKLEIKIL